MLISADVYWGCRLAAAAAYPPSADYCSRYRRHQKVTLVQRGFSFFFFFLKGWESFLELEEFWLAARGSWKLPLCLLLSACENNLINWFILPLWRADPAWELSRFFFQDAKLDKLLKFIAIVIRQPPVWRGKPSIRIFIFAPLQSGRAPLGSPRYLSSSVSASLRACVPACLLKPVNNSLLVVCGFVVLWRIWVI